MTDQRAIYIHPGKVFYRKQADGRIISTYLASGHEYDKFMDEQLVLFIVWQGEPSNPALIFRTKLTRREFHDYGLEETRLGLTSRQLEWLASTAFRAWEAEETARFAEARS